MSNTSIIVLSALAGAAAAVVVLLVWNPGESADSGSGAGPASKGPTDPVLVSIEREMKALRADLQRLMSPGTERVETSDFREKATADSLRGASDALRALIEQLGRSAKSPIREDLRDPSLIPNPETRDQYLVAMASQTDEEFRRAHLFLTHGEIIARYGIPDEIIPQDATAGWQYRKPSMTFRFHDGVVIGAFK